MYRCSHPIIPIIRCAPVLDFTNRYLQLLCCHQHPSHPDNLQLPPCHTMQAKIFDDNNKNICCQLTKGTISPPTEVLSNWGRRWECSGRRLSAFLCLLVSVLTRLGHMFAGLGSDLFWADFQQCRGPAPVCRLPPASQPATGSAAATLLVLLVTMCTILRINDNPQEYVYDIALKTNLM